jgi:threonine dehydrogenase-like Zn-dependent dehydrogenase
MRSAVLVEPFRIEVVEQELPALGPSDVLIEVTQCGVCTSDVDFWQGKSERQMPEPLGHEPAGVVLEVGRDVKAVAPGSRVACWVEGAGFSDALITDERFCIAIGDECQHPAIAEPLSCIVNTVEIASPSLGDDIVIIGAGFMGNLLQLAVQLRGPNSVTVADVRPAAVERARQLGATHTINVTTDDLTEHVALITDGDGADVVFEVTGTNSGLDLADATTRMNGKLCIVGYHQDGMRQIRLGHWNWMAFNIVNAHFRDKTKILAGMRTATRLMSSNVLDVNPLITHTYPLEQIDEAFHAAASKPDNFVKAIIEPSAFRNA